MSACDAQSCTMVVRRRRLYQKPLVGFLREASFSILSVLLCESVSLTTPGHVKMSYGAYLYKIFYKSYIR